MFDNKGRIIRTAVTSITILLLSSIVVVFFMNLKNKEDEKDVPTYVGTTSRRTIKKTSSNSKKTTTTILYEEDDTTTTTTVTTTLPSLTTTTISTETTASTVDSTTTKTTTKKTTTTTKKTTTTTKKTTKKTTTTKAPEYEEPPSNDREVTISSTTYPGALDDWEWAIVDLINEERESMDLQPLQVAVEFRDLAEYAADYWYDHSNTVIDEIIGNNSYYGRKLINAKHSSYSYLFDQTISNTDVTTNPAYEYVGVGVIYRDVGDTGMPTHYFIIIYE